MEWVGGEMEAQEGCLVTGFILSFGLGEVQVCSRKKARVCKPRLYWHELVGHPELRLPLAGAVRTESIDFPAVLAFSLYSLPPCQQP